MRLPNYLILCSILLTLFFGCNGGEVEEQTVNLPKIKDVPASSWERLSKKRIYFGHYRVGYNIVEGIKGVIKDNPQIKLNILETYNPDEFDIGVLAHSKIGCDYDPKSKLDAFSFLVKVGAGARADMVFFKYSFYDINAWTDLHEVFTTYKNTFDQLLKTHPETTFIHVTVPLTCKAIGTKRMDWAQKGRDLIKRILGRPVLDYFDNNKRYEFNELIRKEYAGKEALFDLAKIESTFPDGRRLLFKKDGKTYYSLVPDYTDDGFHLNREGSRILAEQLLILLAKLSDR